ncbi:unnamed protein product, partial [Linum tenue]
ASTTGRRPFTGRRPSTEGVHHREASIHRKASTTGRHPSTEGVHRREASNGCLRLLYKEARPSKQGDCSPFPHFITYGSLSKPYLSLHFSLHSIIYPILTWASECRSRGPPPTLHRFLPLPRRSDEGVRI